ncbi:MAG TPA: MFS transporter [Acidisphaera sp.]|nr:MFS transporter [Acidisphaera sp.]
MRRRTLMFGLTALALAGCGGEGSDLPPLPSPDIAAYRLGPGDKVRIITFGEEQLTGEFRVNDSGMIALPLVGGVKAAGLTSSELEAAVGDALVKAGLLRKPSVTVEIIEYRHIYVLGEVNKPGEYAYHPGMTVLSAVAVAASPIARSPATRGSYARPAARRPRGRRCGTASSSRATSSPSMSAGSDGVRAGGASMTDATRRRLGVMAAGFATFLNMYAIQAVLPLIAQTFGVSAQATTWAITATLLAVAGVAPFAGSVSDMLGRKRLIVGAAGGLVVPSVLVALAPTLGWLVAWRFVQGLTLPFIFTVTIAYIGDETEGADTIRLAGTYSVGTIIGGFAGRMFAGAAAEQAGWRFGFLVLAALTAASAGLVAVLLPRERRFRPVRGLADTLRGLADHLTNARLLATCLVGFGVLFTFVNAFTYANFLLAAPPYGLGPAALGSVFVVYLVGLVTTPAAMRGAARFGRRPILAVSVAVAVTGLLVTLLHSLAAIVAGLMLMAAGGFIEQALATGFTGVAVSRARSAAVGLYVTCYYIGGSVGGIAPAGLWHRFGWPGCVSLGVAVQLVVLAVAWPAWRERRL